jgi:hypothetical protein
MNGPIMVAIGVGFLTLAWGLRAWDRRALARSNREFRHKYFSLEK